MIVFRSVFVFSKNDRFAFGKNNSFWKRNPRFEPLKNENDIFLTIVFEKNFANESNFDDI